MVSIHIKVVIHLVYVAENMAVLHSVDLSGLKRKMFHFKIQISTIDWVCDCI